MHNKDADINTNRNLLEKRIAKDLSIQKKEGLYRNPPIILNSNSAQLEIENQSLINFSSNDYLGLAESPITRRLLLESIQNSQVGSGSSRLISANRNSLLRAENEFADFFGYEAALFFSSGYQANTALISTLFKSDDILYFDKQIHASMIKGMQLSDASLSGFNHNSLAHLEKRLAKRNLQQNTMQTEKASNPTVKALLIESCYSMHGDSPDFDKMSTISQNNNLLVIADEAHAVGILGKGGRGLTGKKAQTTLVPDIKIGTLGKAFGFFGAFILCSNQIKEYLVNFASPLIYTTALPPFYGDQMSKLLPCIAKMDSQREEVAQKADFCREQLKQQELPFSGDYQIITIDIGKEERALSLSHKMKKIGYSAAAIRFPTVGFNKAILRIGITLSHTEDQIFCFARSLGSEFRK